MTLGVMEVKINLDIAPLTDFLMAASLTREEYEGLLAEKLRVGIQVAGLLHHGGPVGRHGLGCRGDRGGAQDND